MNIKILLSAAVCLLVTNQAFARPPVIIMQPKEGADVSTVSFISGKLTRFAHPVVLVKAKDDTKWWVQPQVNVKSDGTFKSKIRLGNANTPNDKEFELVVLVYEDVVNFTDMISRVSVDKIPRRTSRSAIRNLKLKKEKKPVETAGIVIPEPEESVKMEQNVLVKLPVGGFPLILVRCEDPMGSWWVQTHAKPLGKDQFSTIARFGNLKTDPKTQFRLAVYVLEKAEDLAKYEPGKVTRTVPGDDLLFKSFVVQRGAMEDEATRKVPDMGSMK